MELYKLLARKNFQLILNLIYVIFDLYSDLGKLLHWHVIVSNTLSYKICIIKHEENVFFVMKTSVHL